ncbi:MAG TPA: hypothetical protein VIG08_17940 [Gemmatimonadales bacterium]|jgi:Tfp pilus assembly protein PilO
MIQGQIPVPPVPPDFDPNLFINGNGPPLVVLVLVTILTAATIILWPIMRALGRRLENKAAPDASMRAELELLQHRIAELEPMQARVAELEERLDFAERLLAQGKDAERLPR